MNVEQSCFRLIPHLSNCFDRGRQGVAIDIGVGTATFYCDEYRKQGFRTFAVEPLPSESLKALCREKNINLLEGVIYLEDGTIDIYTGEFEGNTSTDLSSLKKDWWGINKEMRKVNVQSFTLKTLINRFAIGQVTFMKVDTEGSEYEILSQLSAVDEALLPKVVEFEYGGGAARREKTGGWTSTFFNSTVTCLEELNKLKYTTGILIERENDTPVFFNLQEHTDFEKIFGADYVYGNIICLKEPLTDQEVVNRLLSEDGNGLFKRFLNKVRQKVV